MSLYKLLNISGLSSYQISLFMTILKHPSCSAKELSKISKVPLGRIYTELDSLEKLGFVDYSANRPKKYLITSPRTKILRLIESEKNKLEIIENSALEEFVNLNKKSSEVFHTRNEMRQSQIDCFKWATEEVCQCLGSLHKASESKDLKTIYEKEIINAVKRGVIFRALYQKKDSPPKIIYELNKKYPKIMRIRFSERSLPRFDIIDKNQLLLKIQDPIETFNTLGTVIINNISLAKKLRTKFMKMWDEVEDFKRKN